MKNIWLEVWETGNTVFHQKKVNPYLAKYFLTEFNLKKGDRVLVPLCGKTQDMLWLSEQGFKVTGIELSPIACRDFFVENNLSFEVTKENKLTRYGNAEIEIFCGDIFDFNPDNFQCAAIYDRAALVALPSETRSAYADHLAILSRPGTVMLLLVSEFGEKTESPPYTVTQVEMDNIFGKNFSVIQLRKDIVTDIPPHLAAKGYKSMALVVYSLRRY